MGVKVFHGARECTISTISLVLNACSNLLQDDKVRIASMRQQRKINDADLD
jgi:hypothetical protein